MCGKAAAANAARPPDGDKAGHASLVLEIYKTVKKMIWRNDWKLDE